MVVKIMPNEKGQPTGKLADAEVHFTEARSRACGCSGSRCGSGATAPAATSRSRRAPIRSTASAAASRCCVRSATRNAQNAMRDLVLQAYAEFESQAAVAS